MLGPSAPREPRPPCARSLPRAIALGLAWLSVAPACGPGGSGGSGVLDGIDLGDDDTGDVGGGGQPGAFLVVYPRAAGFTVVGEPFEPLTPTASVDVEAYTITPALPEGLALDPLTGTIAGTPLVAWPATMHSVLATAPIGSATAEVQVEVAGPTRFAFVANSGDNTISSFTVDAASGGRMRHLGYHIQTPFQIEPEVIAIHPFGTYVYTANLATATLAAHRVDPATGALQDVDTDAIGHGPHALAVHPAGGFVYALSNAVGTLRAFRVEPGSGELEQVGSSIQTLADPIDLMMAPNGRYLLVVHRAPAIVQGYRIDASSGLPQLVSELALGEDSLPLGGAIGLQSDNAYVTLLALESLARIAVQPITGALTLAETTACGAEPGLARIDPRGSFVYVAHAAGRGEESFPGVTIFGIDADLGTITSVVDQDLGTTPRSLDFAPDGSAVYSVDPGAMTVARYAVSAATGELAFEDLVRARRTPASIALLAGDQPLVAEATHLYVASEGTGSIASFALDATIGTPSATGTPLAAGTPISLAVDPFQRYLWVGDGSAGSERLIGYMLDAAGVPTELFALPLDGRPSGIGVEPTGRFLYVCIDGAENRVQSYAILAGGVLGGIDTDVVGPSPAAVSADPTGQFLYVVNRGDRIPGNPGDVTVFSIEKRTGLLTREPPDALAGGGPTVFAIAPSGARAYSPYFDNDLIGTYNIAAVTGSAVVVLEATTTGNEPIDLELAPSGRAAYAAVHDSSGSGAIELFDVRESDGVLYDSLTGLRQARASFDAGLNPIALAVEPRGRNLYVLNQTSSDLTTFSIVEANGALIELDLDPVGMQPSALALSIRIH